ncbi:non-ribosomal peptide synthetase [Yoonia sp. BS5-3]|uniref:Non-ribosomal peptide synthetase n=1 Tax=Yoonia phaeophyticola TaxID=3137369 RepID=A0ABZ2V425_9RHOB
MNALLDGSVVEISHCVFDLDATIPSLFCAQAQHCPDKIAVVQDGRRISYADLAGQAAGVANALLASGIRKGDRVAILAHRSVDAVAAQLGVTAIGAAFVPLDPDAPQQHLRQVIAEAQAKTILAGPGQVTAVMDQTPVISLDIAPATQADFEALVSTNAAAITAADLAYVIYTSGSTGRPKGVMVAHRGVCRLVRGQSYADLGPDQVMLNMAAVGFDASIGEIYSAVLNGGTLAILPDPAPSLDRIEEVIAENQVTIAYITAGLFHIIAEHRPQILAPLRQVFPCGDVLSETHVKRMRAALPHLRMINGYGPTENTVFTCCYPIDENWTGGPVPIGRGLNHDHLFVLDEGLEPLPAGEIGQLAVGGAGVGIGYLGRPDLTDASFVTLQTDDFQGRVYLTGDLVAMDGDGIVRFHGRSDRQVKINGQRVELDTVEYALRQDGDIQDAAVVALRRPDQSQQIVAFVKPAPYLDGNTDLATDVLSRLRTAIPAAAVPSQLMIRDSFPLSASGKVDRKALLAALETRQTIKPVQPASLGGVIRQVWQDILSCEITDENRTFFELGGTSLQLIAAHALLQERLGRTFDIALMFEAPRIRALEQRLDAPQTSDDPIAARRAAMARSRKRSRARAS